MKSTAAIHGFLESAGHSILRASCFLLLAACATGQGVYFSEDFERRDAPAFDVWYKGEGARASSTVTGERAFSGSRSARVEGSAISYFEIPLPKPLKWDRNAPDGIGRRPLYLSARVFVERVAPHAETWIGFQAGMMPKRRPAATGSPIHGGTLGHVNGRTNEWLHLVFEAHTHIHKHDQLGDWNADHLVLTSVSLISYGGGTFYVDDIRLADTPPPGWTPPLPAAPSWNAAASFRRDPRLEAMVLHGAYGGIGSLLGDAQLHPWVMRDMHRLYLNFAGPSFDFRATASERHLEELDLVLRQAQQYGMPVIPMSYIGSRYTAAAAAMSDDQLRAAMLKIVRRYRENPWLLAWYLEEEPGPDRAATYLKEKSWVEEADPNRNCLMIFNAREGMDAIGPAQSVVMRDIYPIGGPNPNPWIVPRQVAMHARQFEQPFVLTTQLFGGGCCWTPPTVGQFRLMTYGALAEGAKGFCHYAYGSSPFQSAKIEQPEYGRIVDPYGAPGPIHRDIQRHLGPDLFSIGELLRTCRPADVPAAVTMTCGNVEDAHERELPALAVRRLTDTKGRYDILAVYNNNPVAAERGTLRIERAWAGDRWLIDLSAHSRLITRVRPIRLDPARVTVRLEAGHGRFFALLPSAEVVPAIERMQTRRLEAVRKMVEFDWQWLRATGVRPAPPGPGALAVSTTAAELAQWLAWDRENQRALRRSTLGRVLDQIEAARGALSAAHETLADWARYRAGEPFPPEVEPTKSWCDRQDALGELFVGFFDLAHRHPPGELLAPVRALARLCEEHRALIWRASSHGAPRDACPAAPGSLGQLRETLTRLGWERPLTSVELHQTRDP